MDDASARGSADDGAKPCQGDLQAEFLAALEAMLSAHHDRLVRSLHQSNYVDPGVFKNSSFTSQREQAGESSAPAEYHSARDLCSVRSASSSPDSEGTLRRTSTTFSTAEAQRRSEYLSEAAREEEEGDLTGATWILQSVSTHLRSIHGGRRWLRYARLRIRQLVGTDLFDVVMLVLVLSNVIFCGVEVEYMAWSRLRDPPMVFYWASLVYTVIFGVEVLLRFIAQGWSFFRGTTWKWNIFELLIILVSVLEVFVGTEQGGGRAVPSIRILRMARLVRVLRIVRIMRQVRALRILIYSVINTIRSLLWTLVLMFVILYMFGLLFTQATTEHLLDSDAEHIDNLEAQYGTLGLSIFTLFKAISGGVSWQEIVQPLSELNPMWVAFYLFYFTFTYFAVLNVVTGVFCQTAIESAGQDQEMAAQAQLASKQFYIRQLESIFKQINTKGTGKITLLDFEQSMEDEQLKAYFASIDLTVDEAFSLFELLDGQSKHVLTIDAFVTGCLKLRGQAKTIDIAMMMYETRWSLKRCLESMQAIEANIRFLRMTGNQSSMNDMDVVANLSTSLCNAGPGKGVRDVDVVANLSTDARMVAPSGRMEF